MNTAALLLRIVILIPFAYGIACIAAALFVMLAIVGLKAPEGAFYLIPALLVGAWAFSVIGLVPALVAIVVAEIYRIRSWLYFTAIGAAVGALMSVPGFGGYGEFLAGFFAGLGILPTHMTGALEPFLRGDLLPVSAAAGIVGGFIYWTIAGRYSSSGWVTSSESGSA